MITKIDYVLDRVTMYRLVLYVLFAFIAVAAGLAYFKLLPFTPLELLASTALLLVICWAMNTIFAFLFRIPTNIESASDYRAHPGTYYRSRAIKRDCAIPGLGRHTVDGFKVYSRA